MFCNQCGTKLPDDALFCPECGAKQEVVDIIPDVAAVQNVQPAPEKKKWKPYKIFIPVGVVLTAAILVFAFILVGNRKASPFIEVSKDIVIYMDDGLVNLSGEKIDITEAGSYVWVWYSGDGSTTVFLNEDDTLFCINDKLEPVLVAEDVINVKMSLTGDYFAYLVSEDGENYNDAILYIYDVKKDKSTKISKDVNAYNICISPDGRTVAYLKDYESYDDNTLYLCTLGKDEKKVDKDGCYPIAVTDNGKYFYYANTNNKLYCFNGKETEKIATDISGEIWFNSSISEMLFIKNGKTYYYSPKIEEPVRVCGSAVSSVVVLDADMMDMLMYECCNNQARMVGKDSLKDSILVTNSDLYWLNKDGTDTVKIASYIYDYQLSADGKSLLYIEDGELYKIKKFDENMEAQLLYDDEYLYGFVASRDLSKIYIVTDESELFYLKGKNKTERISNDLDTYFSSSIAYNDVCNKIFYIEDGDLYCAGTSKKSKEKVAENVDVIIKIFDGIVYDVWEDGTDTYYYMEKEPVELMSEEY